MSKVRFAWGAQLRGLIAEWKIADATWHEIFAKAGWCGVLGR
jgi:hypothetical protein